MKRIAILGSTGSIGRSALDVIEQHADRLQVVGLAAGGNARLMAEQARRHRPLVVSMASRASLGEVRDALDPVQRRATRFVCGFQGLMEVAIADSVDLLLCASSGTDALEAVLAAIARGTSVALANKEVLVMAGALMMSAARARGATILPVDSEHNAIHQCLHERRPGDLRRLILTASGGPFREWTAASLSDVSPSEALSHPTWKMGRKITVDSATLMNKGLEVIEAHWLFGVGADRIDVVIHPQSVVHSLVELTDGSVIAQLGVTDMRLPIQYAFSYPERWETRLPPLELTKYGRLEFFEPDVERFPCLRHAYHSLRSGGAFPIVLNAANEVAVDAFLDERLSFAGIPALIERALDAFAARPAVEADSLAAVREVDRWARAHAEDLLPKSGA